MHNSTAAQNTSASSSSDISLTPSTQDSQTGQAKASNKEALLTNLSEFRGTVHYHRVGQNIVATDGVLFLAEHAPCFWLLAIIDSIAHKLDEDFAVLDLKVQTDQGAKVHIHNGYDPNDPIEGAIQKDFHKQDIAWTDFPLESLRLFIGKSIQ